MLKQAALEFGRALADVAALEFFTHEEMRRSAKDAGDSSGKLEELVRQALGNLKRVCILSDMDDALPEIDRFGDLLTGSASYQDIYAAVHHLRYRIIDDLQHEYYVQIAKQDVSLYDNRALFGDAVGQKFPTARDDIKDAGNCLAIQQPTACVFHLMRAMEVAVRQLSKRLGVVITPQTTWRMMTGNMDDKIKKMPDKTDKQKKKKNEWEAARANLHHVGSVWRNNTMHPAATYTASQAHDVMRAVRVFMTDLCAL